MHAPCPLYPRKRTLARTFRMSVRVLRTRPRRRAKLIYSPPPQLSLDPFRSHSRGTCLTCFVLLRQDLRTPMRIIYALFLSAAAVFFACAATARQTEKRIALVVGN